MKRKRIMIIGPRGCGKTTLAHRLNNEKKPLRRTQDTIYGKWTLDVPSAYLENTWMYRHLIALSQDAWCIVAMVDASNPTDVYSPGFARIFRCPVIGVITQTAAQGDSIQAKRTLESIGVAAPYFSIDDEETAGYMAFTSYLKNLKEGKGIE